MACEIRLGWGSGQNASQPSPFSNPVRTSLGRLRKMIPHSNLIAAWRVQPNYALPTLRAKHFGSSTVVRIETPGNGLLVDAALGASRLNQYVPVFLQSLRATY